ncbi:MAG TPA: metallopeptidase family protein [Gemmatimonadales bacterium]|nr:metallopeptidase family protein [Gemmatimonadales bacterium]
MRLSDFETMIRRMTAEVPPEFLDGIAEIVVSPRTVPHPGREEIYTLGECIPLSAADGGSPESVQSRVVLYHGSFRALAAVTEGFGWREEAWETLTHELRHHIEWRARAPDLETFDWAVEQNFARQDGERFDPGFFLDGEPMGPGRYRVDDDVFLDRIVTALPAQVAVVWEERRYRVRVPEDAGLPAFLTLEGVAGGPPGNLVLVLRRRPGLLSLLRPGRTYQATVTAEPAGYLPDMPASSES